MTGTTPVSSKILLSAFIQHAEGKRLRYVHPVYLSAEQKVVFFPQAVSRPDSFGRRIAKSGYSLRPQALPQFNSIDGYLNLVEQHYGADLRHLVRLGGIPVLAGPLPDKLKPAARAELMQIVALSAGSRLAYLKKEKMYVLVENAIRLGHSTADSFQLFEAAPELSGKLSAAPPPPPPGSVEHLLASLQLPKSSFVRGNGREAGEINFREVAYGISDPGTKRSENEDVFVMDEGFLAVFDGMGGHKHGADTAKTAALLVLQAVRDHKTLAKAIEYASNIIHALGSEDHPMQRRGATAVAARIEGDAAQIAHRGDSRAYVIGRDGNISLVTQDDSARVSHLNHCLRGDFDWPVENSAAFSHLKVRFASGLEFPLTGEDLIQFEAALEEFRAFLHDHPEAGFPIDLKRNVLNKTIGHTEGEPDTAEVQLKDSDLLLLCSDGLTIALKERLYAILSAESQKPVRNNREIAQLLKREAIKAGAPDNVTLVLYEHRSAAPQQTAPPPPARTILYELAHTSDPAAIADLLDAIFSGNKEVPDEMVLKVISRMGRIISVYPDHPALVSKAMDVIELLS